MKWGNDMEMIGNDMECHASLNNSIHSKTIFKVTGTINNINKFLAHDNDFPAFWLAP